MLGITSFGGYVPRLRLSRTAIVDANAWFNPGLKAWSKGERSFCNWDEDVVTMAVEAARDCLGKTRPKDLHGLFLASTTAPFRDRQNAGILAAALNLPETLTTMDIGASQRAGTTGLINALNVTKAGAGRVLLVAAEKRRSRAAAVQELLYGDGAAALGIGQGEGVVAEFIAAHQIATDFVDHYRGQDESFDYHWEERWIRDEGYLKIVPRTLAGLLEKAGFDADRIDYFIMPSVVRGVAAKIAQRAGIPATAVYDNLHLQMGEAGCAHPLILLSHCLQAAKAGETILLVGWGQGCDALLFRTTGALGHRPPYRGISGALAAAKIEHNYNRYLAFNDLILQEKGLRAELDKQTALSTLYRKREMILGFTGGKCRRCGTVQFPKSNICVNPNCGASHSQDPYPFADIPATVQSWTADNLTYTPDPPQYFGMVTFAEGGRLMADLTDIDAGEVAVGMAMRMVFRIKEFDAQRGFPRYFWKAAPDRQMPI